MSGILYLIPVPLGGERLDPILPPEVLIIVQDLKHFIVESAKTARKYLKILGSPHELRTLWIQELKEQSNDGELASLLMPILSGHSIGLMSEAGCPGIADPGAHLVRLAHERDIRVVPLVGPSSILLALMASGASGQQFRFNGYLPVQEGARIQTIQRLENDSYKFKQSEIFIETPYRNQSLLSTLLSVARPKTRLTIACDLTLPEEFVKSKTINEWHQAPLPHLHKRLTVFILFAERL